MRWLIARSMALIADDGELGTGGALTTLVEIDLDEVDAFDVLDGCDDETFSDEQKQ